MRIDWDAVVAELGPALYRYFRASSSAQNAEDLTQATLIRLVEKTRAGRFDPALGSLRMYAYGIAHFVRLEFLRDRPTGEQTLDDVDPADGAVGTHERLELVDDLSRLRRAIAQLPEVQRQVVALYVDQDLTLAEIAIIVGSPESTVKSHVRRAKIALSELMRED